MTLVVLAIGSAAASLPPKSRRPLRPSKIAQARAETMGGPSMASAGRRAGSGFSCCASLLNIPTARPRAPSAPVCRKRRRSRVGMTVFRGEIAATIVTKVYRVVRRIASRICTIHSDVFLRQRAHDPHRLNADAHHLADQADDVLLVVGAIWIRADAAALVFRDLILI